MLDGDATASLLHGLGCVCSVMTVCQILVKVTLGCFQGETLASITGSGISPWCGFGSSLALPTLQLSSA